MAETQELQIGDTSSMTPSDGDDQTDLTVPKHEHVASNSVVPDTTEASPSPIHEAEEGMSEPMCFGRFIVRCPFLLCAIMMLILILVTLIDATVFELSDQNDRLFLVENNKYVEAFDAYNLAGQQMADNAASNLTVLPQTETDDFWIYQHMFTLKDCAGGISDDTDCWILTRDTIPTIIKYEDMIVQDEEWRNQYCYAGDDPIATNFSCAPAIVSVARLLYEMDDYDDMTDAEIKDFVLDNIEGVAFHFNPGVDTYEQTYLYRSFFYAAKPIATEWDTENGSTMHYTDYQNALDGASEQQTAYVDWATPLFKELTVDEDGRLSDGDLELLSVSWVVYQAYFNTLLSDSMVFLVFAVLIVLCYMTIHLSSFFLAACALFQILMSFPLAYFLYRIVFQIPHYDTLSSLIIFVLLGVGADDVFVFTDAWLQSAYFVKSGDSVEETNIMRMSFAFRRAAKAMLVTQVTTFFAFLATATSSLMPISAFGIWAASVVACNYVLVITMYPAILVIHHRFLKKYESACLCCLCNRLCCPSNKKTENKENLETAIEAGATNSSTQAVAAKEDADEEDYRCIESFLGLKWSSWIQRFKIPILLFFVVLFIIAAVLGAQVEAQSEDEKWFADEHYMQRAQDLAAKFSASETDNLVQTRITFGIEGVNRDGTSKWEPDDYGTVVWDDDFSIASPEAQLYLWQICNDTRTSDLAYRSDLVDCPIEDFIKYLNSTDKDFPYEPQSASDPSFNEVYFDFLASEFGTDTLSGALSYVEYSSAADDYVVRFYAMYAYTTVTWTANAEDSRNTLDSWDAWIDEFSADCPDSVCSYVENVSLRWCWLQSQTAFVQSAVQGILIAMPLAFIILLLSTRNWIMAVFAVFDIIGIMLCELAIMFLLGWKFGVSECVAIVIIIGFSVDYVVHLANAYLESTATDRVSRLKFALLTMGISVVSGAVTTFAAGFFLIFPEIIFFQKMGVLIMSTVFFSIFWAMCFFTSIVALWGPQGDAGDLTKYFKKCKRGGGRGGAEVVETPSPKVEEDGDKGTVQPLEVEAQV